VAPDAPDLVFSFFFSFFKGPPAVLVKVGSPSNPPIYVTKRFLNQTVPYQTYDGQTLGPDLTIPVPESVLIVPSSGELGLAVLGKKEFFSLLSLFLNVD
jgi:hypothetical protein